MSMSWLSLVEEASTWRVVEMIWWESLSVLCWEMKALVTLVRYIVLIQWGWSKICPTAKVSILVAYSILLASTSAPSPGSSKIASIHYSHFMSQAKLYKTMFIMYFFDITPQFNDAIRDSVLLYRLVVYNMPRTAESPQYGQRLETTSRFYV